MLGLYRPIVSGCKARPFSFSPRAGMSRYGDCVECVRPEKLLTLELEVTPQTIWGRFPGDVGIGGEMQGRGWRGRGFSVETDIPCAASVAHTAPASGRGIGELWVSLHVSF